MRFVAIFFLFFLAACGKDSSHTTISGSVLVLNEGGFMHGNASVSIYNPSAKAVANDVFKNENGFSLGDVAQSMYLQGDTAFIVLNNSAKIVVASVSQNFKYLYSIPIASSSPRFFMPVNSTKAYVTELYANKIWIVDYKAGTVTGSIPVPGWTEQMLAYQNHIYVLQKTAPSATASHQLLMLDTATDQVVNSIHFNTDPSSMTLADNGKLYVMTTKQDAPAIAASIYVIDLASFHVERHIDFATGQSPAYLRYASYTHQLLYANNGIYQLSLADTAVSPLPFIVANSWNVYGLNADPTTGDIYISDAIDYQQASRVMRYSKDGTLLDAFNAGIITNGFSFK